MSKILFLHIKNCSECPYLENYDRNYIYCGHHESPKYSEKNNKFYNSIYEFPNWCPLTNNEPHDVDDMYKD